MINQRHDLGAQTETTSQLVEREHAWVSRPTYPRDLRPIGKSHPKRKVAKLPNDVSAPWQGAHWFLDWVPNYAQRRRPFGRQASWKSRRVLNQGDEQAKERVASAAKMKHKGKVFHSDL
jgi:hypothetical protein